MIFLFLCRFDSLINFIPCLSTPLDPLSRAQVARSTNRASKKLVERSREKLAKVSRVLLSSAKADNHSKLCPLDKLYCIFRSTVSLDPPRRTRSTNHPKKWATFYNDYLIIITSTRRLSFRPNGVSLDVFGCVSPK